MGGDFNGRIGSSLDYIPDVDDVGGCQPIDLLSNAHGVALLDFLKESKQCILNGRISPNFDNYTSISGRGKAVVDYLISPHASIDQFTKCAVLPIRELCDDIKYKPSAKLPDHSIVLCEFKAFSWSGDMDTEIPKRMQRKFKSHKLPEEFLKSNECQDLINETIRNIEQMEHNQDNVDDIYSDILNIYNKEIEATFPPITNPRAAKRNKFIAKPW